MLVMSPGFEWGHNEGRRILVAALFILCGSLMVILLLHANQPFVWLLGDKLDWQSKQLAGSAAINCGTVRGDNFGRTSRCILNAARKHRAFRAHGPMTFCFDQPCAEGIVGTPDGQFYILHLVGDSGSITKCSEPAEFAQLANLTCFAPAH